MPVEYDDPFAYDDYEECMIECPFDDKTCHEICICYEEIEEVTE